MTVLNLQITTELKAELSGSGISTSLGLASVFDLPNDENQVYEELERRCSVHGHQVPHNFGDSLVFRNEDGSVFQVKPGNPQKDSNGKTQKYLCVSGRPTGVFLPAIPSIHRAALELATSTPFPSGVSYFEWLMSGDFAIVVTEGAKKALALLSCGIPAVGLVGVDGATYRDEDGNKHFYDELIALFTDRAVVLAFDEDEKPKTRARVASARISLAARIGDLSDKSEVRITKWDPAAGKGIDDVLVGSGAKTVQRIISDARSVRVDAGAFHSRDPKAVFTLNSKGQAIIKAESDLVSIIQEGLSNPVIFDTRLQSFYRYTPQGLWVEEPMITIEKGVDAFLREGLRGTESSFGLPLVTNIAKLLKIRICSTLPTADRSLVPMQNGTLDLATMTLLPHSPEYGFRHQLPYSYNPLLLEPLPIIEFLSATVSHDADKLNFLRAYMRAVIVGGSRFQKVLQLVGLGGSGKSTIANLMVALTGIDNIHATSLDSFSSRFGLVDSLNARLMLIDDSEDYSGSWGAFKTITGGAVVSAEKKSVQEKVRDSFKGMVVITANSPLKWSDTGMDRRVVSIRCNNVVQASQVRQLINVDCDGISGEFASMIPALFNWAVSMPDAEMEQVIRFSASSESMKSDALEVAKQSDPMVQWASENLVFRPDAVASIGKAVKSTVDGVTTYLDSDLKLYASYCEWCLTTGRRSTSINKFSTQLTAVAKQHFGTDLGKTRDRFGTNILGCCLGNPMEHSSVPEAPEVAEVVEVAEVTEVVEVTEVTEVAEVTEVVEVAEVTEVVEAAEVTEVVEAVEAAEAFEYTEEFEEFEYIAEAVEAAEEFEYTEAID